MWRLSPEREQDRSHRQHHAYNIKHGRHRDTPRSHRPLSGSRRRHRHLQHRLPRGGQAHLLVLKVESSLSPARRFNVLSSRLSIIQQQLTIVSRTANTRSACRRRSSFPPPPARTSTFACRRSAFSTGFISASTTPRRPQSTISLCWCPTSKMAPSLW
jgi:hypothetical protein